MKKLLDNKLFTISILVTLISLMYCSFQTYIMNDDFLYSYSHPYLERITNIRQIFSTQIADYSNISSRVFVHFIVQFLLMYGKNLWSILNPIVIIVNLCSKKFDKTVSLLISISLFLLLFNYKSIIYWVAGSVNYVWTSMLLFGFIYYYLKGDFNKRFVLNIFVIQFISILHESLLVFMIVFIIGYIIFQTIKCKKLNFKYLLYLIPIVISYMFLLKGPGVEFRLTVNQEWNSLSLFDKLNISFPAVSANLLSLRTIKNIIPTVFIILIIINLVKERNKYSFILSSILALLFIISYLTLNGYLSLLLIIILFISESYLNIKQKREKMILVSLSMYGVVYSMSITSEYLNQRPNYFMYLYMIMLINILFFQLIHITKYSYFAVICAFIIYSICLSYEVYAYYNVGLVKNDRLKQIENYKKGYADVLYWKKIPDEFVYYHIDSNSPYGDDYYAWDLFLKYYNLPSDTEIMLVEW